MDVKKKLEKFAVVIDKKLERYWQEEVEKNFGFNLKQKELVRKMLEHSAEHNLRQAKRLRASFVYYAYLLGRKKIDVRIFKAAMSVELVHTALLMHDDFMDCDDFRRGKPTTHKYFADGDKHYGNSMAVNVGDAVLLMGYELLLRSGFKKELVNEAVIQFLRGVTQTVYGQAYDITLEKLREWKEENVIALHKAKTAIYTYKNPLFIGAILSELSDEVLNILNDYSMTGGVAFQLQDDMLGIFGDPKKTGKSANSDLLQGKCTLLIMKVLEIGSDEEKKALLKVWGKRKAKIVDIDKAKKAIKTSGSLDYSKKISKEYAKKAERIAGKLKSLNLNSTAVDYIQGIARYMVERDV
ncbi:polyprenyl synthetase family protein [Patescibacteria group bacterium]|nr:polyprenyl synthetase family protein [Patescibacteria group bacterium]